MNSCDGPSSGDVERSPAAARPQARCGFVRDAAILLDTETRTVHIRDAQRTFEWSGVSEGAFDTFRRLRQTVPEETVEEWALDPDRAALVRRLDGLGLLERRESASSADAFARYADQMAYYGVFTADETAAMVRLREATVAVVGIGGLGSEVVRHLAAAGVGLLVCIDHDRVEASNLNRQHCYAPSDIGTPKTAAMRRYLVHHAPEVSVRTANRFVRSGETFAEALSIAFSGTEMDCDAIVCCADEPVGEVELACLEVRRRMGCAVAFTAMHIGRGYWGLLTDEAACERAASFFRQAAAAAKLNGECKVRGSASWENSVIGAYIAGAVVTHLAGVTSSHMRDCLVSFDFARLQARVLMDFSHDRSPPMSASGEP